MFLFCCFTGLAYVDIKKLKISEITKGVDGGLWIFTNRQKTDTRSAIPLLPAATQLIKKYFNHPLCINKDMPLPVPSNQKIICRVKRNYRRLLRRRRKKDYNYFWVASLLNDNFIESPFS